MDIVEFGLYIRELREQKGLTLSKLAKLSDVSHPYLSQIENGRLKKHPSSEIIIKLSKPLGVEPIELMEIAGHFDGLSDEEKQMIRQRTLINHDYQSSIMTMFEETLKVLTVDDVFLDFLKDDIQAVQEKYSNYFDVDMTITPNSLRELVNNAEWDQEWIFNLVREFVIIVKKHDLDSEEIANKRKIEERKFKELIDFLNQPNITYNGHTLTDADRELITNMLDRIYPKGNNKG